MTDQFLVLVMLGITNTFGWKRPLERHLAQQMNKDEGPIHAALIYLIDKGHVVDSGSELILTIGGKQWLNENRHLAEADPNRFRYVVFRSGTTPYVYSCRDGSQDDLIKRKMAQERKTVYGKGEQGQPVVESQTGSHVPWDVVEISEDTYETGGAAKRAGREKYGV